MSDIKLKNRMKHLSNISNVKNSEVMKTAIVKIIQMKNRDIKDDQAYRVAKSLLGS